jgi:hypothetical protein
MSLPVSEVAASREENPQATRAQANHLSVAVKIVPVPCDGPAPVRKAVGTLDLAFLEPPRTLGPCDAAPHARWRPRPQAILSSDVDVPPPRAGTER